MRVGRQHVGLFAIVAISLVLAPIALAGSGGPRGAPTRNDPRAEAAGLTTTEDNPAGLRPASRENDASDRANHGHCVSYWRHQAKAQGLDPQARPSFIASIAQDETAVTRRVESGGTPDATCNFQVALDAALRAQVAAAPSDRGRHLAAKNRTDEARGRTDKAHGRN